MADRSQSFTGLSVYVYGGLHKALLVLLLCEIDTGAVGKQALSVTTGSRTHPLLMLVHLVFLVQT